MNASTLDKTGAVLSAAVVVLGGAVTAGVCTSLDSAPALASEGTAVASDAQEGHDPMPVSGQFFYSQDTCTDNGYFTQAFTRAVASLCQATAQYHVADLGAIRVSMAGEQLAATVDEIADESGAASMVTACACASNGPGGGAMGNAEVSGASIESVMTFVERSARK